MAQKEGSKAQPVVGHSIVEMTPRKAKELLAANTENRRLRPKVVAAYRRDMELGHWMFTGDPIQVSRTQQLLNGQHRLTALAESQGVRSIPFLVITGLPDEVKTMLDQGIARTAADALLLEHGKVKHVTVAAALARWVRLFPQGPGPDMNPNSIRAKITNAEVLETFNQYPEIPDISLRAVQLRPVLPGSPTAIAYSYFFANRINKDAASEFFNGILNQDMHFGNDPRKALVKRMRRLHEGNLKGEFKQPTTLETGIMMVSAISRTWNAWRQGEEMTSINTRNRLGQVIPPVKMI